MYLEHELCADYCAAPELWIIHVYDGRGGGLSGRYVRGQDGCDTRRKNHCNPRLDAVIILQITCIDKILTTRGPCSSVMCFSLGYNITLLYGFFI